MGFVAAANADKAVGILGGMGPSATLELYRRFIAAVDAQVDQDHPRIIIDGNARIPDRTTALIADGPSPTDALVAGVTTLARAGAACVVIPCNTAHAFLAQMRAAVEIPVIDMIDETAAMVAPSVRTVGVLATTGTLAVGLYQHALAAHGFDQLVMPDSDDQESLMAVIAAVKQGESAAALPAFLAVCDAVVAAGAEALILGCTELSVIADGVALPVAKVDPLDALVVAGLTAVGYSDTAEPVLHS